MIERALRAIGRGAALAISLTLASGCATDHVSPEDPTASIPDRSAGIALGQTGRTGVRAALGEPLLSSRRWGFDLFRADTTQTDVILAITPWPIPIAQTTDQLQRYTLVAYDTNDRAGAVATGIFRRPAPWRNVSPIASDFRALHLRAADLMFYVDPEGARRENMLAAPAVRDDFLQRARASTRCTVILGCGDRGCADQWSVDSGEARRLPVRIANAYWFRAEERASWLQGIRPSSGGSSPWLEALVAIELSAGEHVLQLSARYLDGRHSVTLACEPGEVTYLVINASDNGAFINRSLVDWRVDRAHAVPEAFARRPLVLVDDGQWYVDVEPDDEPPPAPR